MKLGVPVRSPVVFWGFRELSFAVYLANFNHWSDILMHDAASNEGPYSKSGHVTVVYFRPPFELQLAKLVYYCSSTNRQDSGFMIPKHFLKF